MEGWIKLDRRIINWEWYDDVNTFRLFIHLLLKANHKDKSYRGLNLKAGTILTGRDLLSKELGISVQQVRTALSKLELTKEITIKSSSKGTRIQVVNYKKYQSSNQQNNQRATNEQPTNNQLTTTNKNVKNVKNVKNEEKIEHWNNSQIDVNGHAKDNNRPQRKR